MKLDEKYFKDLKDVILIQVQLTEHPCEIDENDEWLSDILKRIAHDAREYQAGKDVLAIQKAQEKWNLENESTFEKNQIFNTCVYAVQDAALDRAKGE